MAIFMIGVALVYDGTKAFINLITLGLLGWLINPFINIWAQMTFLFWFTFLGVSFLKKGKMQGAKIAAMGVPSVIGLIPIIDSLPFWTSGVATNIAVIYAEDMIESLSPETLKSMGTIANKYKKYKNRHGMKLGEPDYYRPDGTAVYKTDSVKQKEKSKDISKEIWETQDDSKTKSSQKDINPPPQKEIPKENIRPEKPNEFLEFKEKTGTMGRPDKPEDRLPIDI
jgi:hypothetical protein